MELNNKTELAYAATEINLIAIKIKVPSGVIIMANIVGVCEAIADGTPSKEIVKKYDLNCSEDSFPTIFKKTTGVSIRDIGTMTAFDRRRRGLQKLEYNDEQIEEIMKVIDNKEEVL